MDTALSEYFERLTGAVVEPGTVIVLSSAKIGAAQAWLRRKNIAHDSNVLATGRFTLEHLTGGPGPAMASAEAFPVSLGLSSTSTLALAAGIDVETVDAVPAADDYRTDPFCADNFTPAELAYCLERGTPRESLCGLWAAKEAVRKLGVGPTTMTSLRAIEIDHDASGRPRFPGVALSISHAAGLCVAIAVAQPSDSQPASRPLAAPSGNGRRLDLVALGLALLALAVAVFALLKP